MSYCCAHNNREIACNNFNSWFILVHDLTKIVAYFPFSYWLHWIFTQFCYIFFFSYRICFFSHLTHELISISSQFKLKTNESYIFNSSKIKRKKIDQPFSLQFHYAHFQRWQYLLCFRFGGHLHWMYDWF